MYAYCDNNGEIIGYYSLELQDHNQCELNNLCVLPQYRHKHIGAELLADACLKAKKPGDWEIWRTGNGGGLLFIV